jgi:lipopolysaccharide assembly outer membrane protein LptD (OstA)
MDLVLSMLLHVWSLSVSEIYLNPVKQVSINKALKLVFEYPMLYKCWFFLQIPNFRFICDSRRSAKK